MKRNNANSMRAVFRRILLKIFLTSAFFLLHSSFSFKLSLAIEIPLDTAGATGARIGYIDLDRVFNTYPEKSFAEGDLLREIEKRRKNLGTRQSQINLLRQQIAADQAAIDQAKAGRAVLVPINAIPEEEPAKPVEAPKEEKTTVSKSTSSVEAYPTEDPLAGLPGHETSTTLPGMKEATPSKPQTSSSNKTYAALDTLAASGTASPLSPEALRLLQQRLSDNQKALDRLIYQFKDFRVKAIDDMKVLQTQKTHDVMSKIYAILQGVAREENITVVMDKAYVLYGEETVDLTDKLMSALQRQSTGEPLPF